jgi:hypothetical protein
MAKTIIISNQQVEHLTGQPGTKDSDKLNICKELRGGGEITITLQVH